MLRSGVRVRSKQIPRGLCVVGRRRCDRVLYLTTDKHIHTSKHIYIFTMGNGEMFG